MSDGICQVGDFVPAYGCSEQRSGPASGMNISAGKIQPESVGSYRVLM